MKISIKYLVGKLNFIGTKQVTDKDSSSFSRDSSGRLIYYPWSVFGKGYVVNDSINQEQIERFLKTYTWLGSFLIFVVIAVSSFAAQALYLNLTTILVIFWFRHRVNKLVEGLEVVEIGSSSYTPPIPTIEKKYRALFYTAIGGTFAGALGNLYNFGYSVGNFVSALTSGLFICSLIYIKWFRRYW